MKILVPIDGRDYSDESLAFVAKRTPLFGKAPEIELFYVDKNWPKEKSSDNASQFREGAQALFENAKAFFPAGTHNLTYRVAGGTAATAIATEANRGEFDLIVMTSRGQSRLMTAITGSVTFELIEHTRCPVLILRGEATLPSTGLRAGICVDGSNFGSSVTRTFLKNIHMLGKEPKLSLMSVVPTPKTQPTEKAYQAEIDASFRQCTGAIQQLLKAAHVEFTPVPLTGSPAAAIVEASNEQALELLVLGSHGEGARMGAIMGSVTTKIAADACIPLLIIRDQAVQSSPTAEQQLLAKGAQ